MASPDEVRITREGEAALIEYADTNVWATHFTIGPAIHDMTDAEILELHNDGIRGCEQLAREHEYVAVEIPIGQPQIEYAARSDQWVPRGDVLRCIIEDSGADAPSFYIDDRELSLQEFGKMLSTYSGWGMRITFVPDDEVHEEPSVEVREPDR